MSTPEERQAQLERPVRDEGPPPPKSAGPPFGVLTLVGLAVIVAAALLLGVGGLWNAWIVAGLIVVAGGVVLTIQLMRRNRRP